MSAFGGEADIGREVLQCPQMTQSDMGWANILAAVRNLNDTSMLKDLGSFKGRGQLASDVGVRVATKKERTE